MKHFDVVVLGAGSAGELIASTLARAGKKVALVEKLRVGGECAFVSCMPSKSMLRSAQVRESAKNLVAVGAAPLEVELGDDLPAFKWAAKRRDAIVEDREDAMAALALTELGVYLYRGDGFFTAHNELSVNQEKLSWDDLVIATGSVSIIPEIEGVTDIEYWTSDVALSIKKAPKSVAIIGGGPVACELAQIFSRFGSTVSIIELGAQLAGKEHPEIASRLMENLRAEGVEIHLQTEVMKIEKINLHQSLLSLSTDLKIDVERVIVATGRHPNTKGLYLDFLKIQLDEKGAISVDDHCQVKGLEHIYAGGDVTGIAPFTHTANYQARIICENILGGNSIANYQAIPRAIYTDPPVASVGALTIKGREGDVASATYELSELSRTQVDGESGGRLILTADIAKGVLIGAFAIGAHADEWMALATLAIRAEIGLFVLRDIVFAFPTYGQAFEAPIRELADLFEAGIK